MKTLKYILFLLLILIVGFLIYVAVQPNEYDIKRTQLINAPANVIYDNINDIKKWDAWGPWHDTDSTIVTSYSANTIGVGAKSTWTSKDSPGNMELINTVPNKSVDLKMQFSYTRKFNKNIGLDITSRIGVLNNSIYKSGFSSYWDISAKVYFRFILNKSVAFIAQ